MVEAALPTPVDPLRRRPILRLLRNWRQRHRHPFNFWIHIAGIPLALFGLGLLILREWQWGIAGFVVGYLLQYLGHVVEGNDVGEWAALKRLFGRPYVSISPRWQQLDADHIAGEKQPA